MSRSGQGRRPPAPVVRLRGSARLNGAPLFGPIDLTLTAGTWTALLGVSGVGKTTVLRLIAGLDTGAAFAGTVQAGDGRPLAGRVAYMAQQDLLFPWLDVLGNVAVGARLRGEPVDETRARALIDRVGLSADIAKRPGQLSGGMRQRAALARTLMEDRPVVLLDEAFSALDARTRAEMQDLAADLLRGRTVLMVTHDPAEAARMGAHIAILTPSGLESVAAPQGPVPRPYDAREVFETQARLMTRIRRTEAPV